MRAALLDQYGPEERPIYDDGAYLLGQNPDMVQVGFKIPKKPKIVKSAVVKIPATKEIPKIVPPLEAVKPIAKKKKVDELLSKVKHIDELGDIEHADRIHEQLYEDPNIDMYSFGKELGITKPFNKTEDLSGYHVTGNLPGILNSGEINNSIVDERTAWAGLRPKNIGGGYFFSDPTLAKVGFNSIAWPETEEDYPVLKMKLNKNVHSFLPDEDTNADNWMKSYMKGSFSTSNPISLDNLEAIYSTNPDYIKEIIKKNFMSNEGKGK